MEHPRLWFQSTRKPLSPCTVVRDAIDNRNSRMHAVQTMELVSVGKIIQGD